MLTGGGYDNFPAFLKNKVLRLLTPFYFTAFFWVMPFQMYFFPQDRNVRQIFIRYILAYSPAQLWFLFMLFVVFVIIYPLSDFIKENNRICLLFCIITSFAGIIGAEILPNVFQFWTALKHASFFVIGFKLRQYEKQETMLIQPKSFALLFAVDIIIFGIYELLSGSMPLAFIDGLFYDIVCIFGSLMIYSGLHLFAYKIRQTKHIRTIRSFAKHSMAVYLFHQQFIYIVVKLFNGVIHPFIVIILSFFISIIGGLLMGLLFKRNQFARILIGEK